MELTPGKRGGWRQGPGESWSRRVGTRAMDVKGERRVALTLVGAGNSNARTHTQKILFEDKIWTT